MADVECDWSRAVMTVSVTIEDTDGVDPGCVVASVPESLIGKSALCYELLCDGCVHPPLVSVSLFDGKAPVVDSSNCIARWAGEGGSCVVAENLCSMCACVTVALCDGKNSHAVDHLIGSPGAETVSGKFPVAGPICNMLPPGTESSHVTLGGSAVA